MIRDKIKSEKYFDEFIDYENSRIKKFSDVLKSIDKSDSEKINQCQLYLSGFYKNKLAAMYSAGYEKDEIKNVFDLYVKSIPNNKVDSYADMIDLISLSILLDYSEEITIKIINDNKYDDSLINVLSNYIKSNNIDINGKELNFPEEYGVYIDILSNSDEESSISSLQEFLNNEWYALNKDMSWYDSHNNRNNTYFGYWCWISAAVIKMKGLTVDCLTECKYLPIDLI